MTGPTTPGEDVALFIDWENFKISLATGRRQPNVSALKEEVSNLGRVVVAKAYADWVTRTPEIRGASQFINDPPALYAAGIEPVYVPTRLSWGNSSSTGSQRYTRVKNSVDVKMTADCIECAHSHANIGTFVLVSGDSDFIHVVNALRTMGKRVVVIGVSWATSRRLADQVDGLILYDVDVDPVVPEEPAPAPAGNGRGAARTGTPAAGGPDLMTIIREIEEIVRAERQAGGTPLLTSIKQRLMRRFPRFDEKQLGYSGFKKLMARVEQEGNIQLITAGLVDWATMADEPPPSEIEAPSPEPEILSTEEDEVPLAKSRRRRRFPTLRREPVKEDPMPVVEDVEQSTVLAGTLPVDELDEDEPSELPAERQEPSEAYPESQPVNTMSPELQAFLTEATSTLGLPEGPGDGQDAQRIADLIVMADTLEHREGISHVAFNFLVSEVCQAMEQGLEANDSEITQRWAQVYSRGYVAKMFRGLSSSNLFNRGWHSSRDEATGRYRRRRTFNLDREHPVVMRVLEKRLSVGEIPGTSSLQAELNLPELDLPWTAGLTEDSSTIPDEPSDDQLEIDDTTKPAAGFLSRLFRPHE